MHEVGQHCHSQGPTTVSARVGGRHNGLMVGVQLASVAATELQGGGQDV